MSRRANPTIVGSFILGAIALAIAAIAVFGSGSLFRYRPRAVAFFHGNVGGLNVGAPVTLRGVPIGSVTDIDIRVDVSTMTNLIPVYIEFEPERITFLDRDKPIDEGKTREPVLKSAIAHGLRAALVTQSFVTGQLAVDLSFDPEEPGHTVGADPSTVEIPTVQSEIEKVKSVLEKLPLTEIATTALHALGSIDRLASSPEIPSLFRSLEAASKDLGDVMAKADADLNPLVGDVKDTLRSAREALASADGAFKDAQTTLRTTDGVLAKDVRSTLQAATTALERAQTALTNVNTLMVNSQQRYDLDQTLRNLSATSNSLRAFADELQRRPNAMILGR